MKYKEGDRVKYAGKKDETLGLKNGMEGAVLKVTKVHGARKEDSWVEVEVNFDKLDRDRVIMVDHELEPVKSKKNLVKARKLRILDRVTFVDDETGEDVVIVISKLKYSHVDDTIKVTGYREDDTDVTYEYISEVDETVEVV